MAAVAGAAGAGVVGFDGAGVGSAVVGVGRASTAFVSGFVGGLKRAKYSVCGREKNAYFFFRPHIAVPESTSRVRAMSTAMHSPSMAQERLKFHAT